MAKFYIIKLSKGNLPPGAIIKLENRKIFAIDFKTEFNYDNFSIPKDWIELIDSKRRYLQEISLERRINACDRHIFEKLCDMKVKDQCYITINSESRCKYFIKQIKKSELNVVRMDGRERIISIYNIDNIEMINYYICVAKYKSVEPGMIIIDCDGIMKIYPNGDPVSSKENLEKISEEESKFLYKYPCNERLSMHIDKIWEKITKLTINSHCYIATDPSGSLYKIIQKFRTPEGVKYMIQGKDNQSIIVDETDIRAERILPSQSSDATVTSTREYYNYPRQSSLIPRFELVRELYLRNDHKITECERIDGPNQYKLMKILDDPPIYGRALFTIYEQYFTAIRLTPDYVKNNMDKLKDIIFKDGEFMVLVVISSKVELFDDQLEEDRNIIIVDSIKVIDICKPNLFAEKDIVKYLRGNETCYGKVEQVTVLNGVRCLRIIKTIVVGNEDEPVFIRESVATKLDDTDIHSKFIKGVIYKLHSIVTFSNSNMDNIGRNDEVEFQLRGEWEKYKGKVLLTALANNEPCAVVELYMTLKDVDLNLCHVRRWTAFNDLYKSRQNTVIIISSCLLRVIDKKIFKCNNNNVFVLDPNKVGSVKEISKAEKIIIFKCNDDVIIARLRWTGSIDNELFIGCETSLDCKYGTNGTFNDYVLFHSDEGHGVLIPLDRIKDCCVKPQNTGTLYSLMSKVISSHKSLRVSKINGTIVGSSICCVQTLEIFSRKSQLQLGGRVMHVDKRVFGVCRWIGLVNNREVIGVEMTHGGECNEDKLINKLNIFNNMRLFLAEEFVIDTIGLCYCLRDDVMIIDHRALKRVENGNVIDKKIIFYNQEKTMNIKWRGVINGALCVGCELTSECECRTDGFFGDMKLFDCAPRRGVLIPSDSLTDSCELSTHKEINKQQYNAINSTSICCFEELKNITKWKQMNIGSKVKFKVGIFSSEKVGKCKWLGLVNGKESVGVKMNQSIFNGTNGRFGVVDLFPCKEGLGLLFLAEDIDYVEEKEHFYIDKVYNITKIVKVNLQKKDDIGFTIGEYVSINIKNDNNELQIWHGEVKWKGLVNNYKCVGLDLEKVYIKGSNGVLNDKVKFECDPDHGLVIVVDHVNKVNNLVLPFTIHGIIDPERYLKLESKWHKHYVQEKNVSKDGIVTVKFDNDRGILRMNGKLRWSGIMNGEEVAVVELDREYEYGTNGRFWRESIIKCDNYRVIAVPWKNIYKYTPYEGLTIPPDQRIFKELDVNSAVIYYFPRFNKIESLYGTIRWSGVNEHGEFIFGIDLEDRFNGGTDGLFDGHRLFRCNDGHGVLVSINRVVPDIRFIELNIPYEGLTIPPDQRIFKDLDVNSAVIYYFPRFNKIEPLYGTIRWSGVNEHGEFMFGIDLDDRFNDGTDGIFDGQRLFRCNDGHGVLASINHVVPDIRFIEIKNESLNDGTKFFEVAVMDPQSVTTVEAVHNDKWMLDTNVNFGLNESSRKYCGLLKWTGLVNNVMCAVIHVEDISSDDPIGRYMCFKSVIDKMNLTESDKLFIVVMTSLKKVKENYVLLKRMLEFVSDKEVGVDILMNMITTEDAKTLRNVIKEWRSPIILERYPELIPKLLKQDNYEVISVLLDNIVASDIDNEPLLVVAKHFIMTGDYPRFLEASKKCTNVNIVLDNGETFITDVMKTCDDEEVINRVIGSNIFDINMTNKYGDSPLVMACRQCMVTTVRLLLSAGACVSYNNNMALDAIHNYQDNATNMNQVKEANKISKMLTANIRFQRHECNICMDKEVNIVFNCGHTMCSMCSNEFVICPTCKVEITARINMYLP